MRAMTLCLGGLAAGLTLAFPLVALSDDAPAQPAAKVFAPIVERHLDNGMTVVVEEDHRVPLVSLALRYDVGERACPAGLAGVATLTTMLMLHDSKHVPKDDYARLLARAGSPAFNDWTSNDATVLEVTVPSNRLELPLWLWSDQMGFFTGGDDALLASQRVVLEEQRRTALEGAANSRLDEFASEELLPPGHPYRNAAAESTAAIHKIDRQAVLAFHHTWMTPDHATLSIVGDVEPKDALRAVERYFAPIPRGAASARIDRPPPVTLTGQIQLDVAANRPTALVSIRWPTPRFLTTEDARLDIVARVLAGGRTALLYWKLVDEKKVATQVWARERSRDLTSEFLVTIVGAPGRTAVELLTAFDASMDELQGRELSAGQVDEAIYETLVDRFTSIDAAPSRAEMFANYQAIVGTPGYLSHDLKIHQSVSPQIVRDTMTQWMPRDRRLVILVSPDRNAASGGERRTRRFTPAPQQSAAAGGRP